MTQTTMNNTMIKGVNIQMFIRCVIAVHMSENELYDIRLNRYTDIKITEYLFKRNLNGPTVEIKFEMENFNECPWELTLTLNELGGTIEIVDNSEEFEELKKEYERDIMEMYNSESDEDEDEDKNENPPYIRFTKKYQEEKQNLILEFFEDNEDSYEDDLITYINSSNNLVTKRQAFLKGHIESSLICPDLMWHVKNFL